MPDQESAQTPSPIAPSSTAKGSKRTRAFVCRVLRVVWFIVLGLVLLLLTAWVVAALYFDVRVPWLRVPLASIYTLAIAAAWVFIKRRRFAVGATLTGFLLVLGWWLSLTPSNDRDWQPDVAVLPYAEI